MIADEGNPEGWACPSLADVVDGAQSGFASGEKAVKGGLQHLRMNNIGEEGSLVLDLIRTVPRELAKPQHELRQGDVVVCTTNSGKLVGKCAMFDADGDFAFSNHITRLRPKSGVIDSDFLRWSLWLAWKAGEYEELCQHWVNQSTLPKDALLATKIPLPPLTEQRRIVAKVDAVLARVNAARQRLARVPALLRRFRQSILAAACSGRLTADWRETNSQEPMLPSTLRDEQLRVWRESERTLKRLAKGTDDGALDPLPPTWARACIAQCLSEAPCNGISPPGREMPPGVAALKLNAMTNNGFDYNAIKYIQIEPDVADDLRVITSDFFVSRGNGSSALVGRGTLAQTPPQLIVFPDTMIRLRFLRMVQATNWIPMIWDSRIVRLQIEAKAKTSAGIWKISQPDLCSIVVPLPPLPEQHEIVRRIGALFVLADKIEARVTAATARADKLIQATLAKAFRGNLVPTEAELAEFEGREFETAHELLDRVHGERNLAAPAPERNGSRRSASVARKAQLRIK
jgi:type I restriction enzyme, S subunit